MKIVDTVKEIRAELNDLESMETKDFNEWTDWEPLAIRNFSRQKLS